MGLPNFNNPRPTIVTRVTIKNPSKLVILAQRVATFLLANIATYATPVPTVATLQTAIDNLRDAIEKGNKTNRMSSGDRIDLKDKATRMLLLLRASLAYVQSTIDQNAGTPSSDAALLALSGFGLKNQKSKSGLISAVRNLHAVNNKKFPGQLGYIAWKKPLNLLEGEKIPAYNIYVDGSYVDTVTKTSWQIPNVSVPPVQITIAALGSAGVGVKTSISASRYV